MTARDHEETTRRGEYLVLLRHGIRQSSRLAQQLACDAIVGNEARGLLGRLQAIRTELDAMAATPDLRRAETDPIWSNLPKAIRHSGANQAGR